MLHKLRMRASSEKGNSKQVRLRVFRKSFRANFIDPSIQQATHSNSWDKQQ